MITTTRAYSDLELQGFVAVMQGKGCFVLRKDSQLVREQLLRRIEEHLCAAINAARVAKLPLRGVEEDAGRVTGGRTV